ncbi:glycerol-3-phosphate 1-O-acyltransferase PlsY [Paraclostridium bifermentans]|jgi:glycerol-3-phosphate acyltransferase PlsY|uniref:Glycerol-3-phosphate acyltransferase n=1 Tax=Paraclostridium bifermentans TaxID=1490 RepID=A0ABY8R585_PARBF|nr:glycerol-3-phosphate 1-O-acyltransferase PlsY [Paraclostridium bifermentans]RDC50367.1 glycerol-3-phosphate 1-O-acyltransferase [Acinetobacter sp. RIT592]MBS5952798.1 glycerol-3-phosphate 1-O-acyltransferase PlsY [Paraclostridium bifermentans]MBS6507692.1 glycerol-3-phosphate 1-O-acyltransferase PlsY [Paraclostridium bifermentans]MBU5288893.1 glycerol-3-phosphate 1-O-acyltransferase PlsY [Paraclostridium bifermentans]MDU3335446.1 glycerol-3-phosphate 1-O-acyltransferase PlsY [Paraclostridiu
MINYLIIILVSYFIGSISTSYIIAKRMMGVDIRTQGSGNAGSTNVLRTLGKKAGILTFVGDLLKGVVAVLIAKVIATIAHTDVATASYIAVVFVVIGHNWPIYLGFRGGKGVATSLGAMIAVNPVIALSCFAFFILIVYVTKYVSLGSVLGICTSPIIMFFIGNYKGLAVTLFLSASVIFKHRENIKRLLNGTERKIGEKK